MKWALLLFALCLATLVVAWLGLAPPLVLTSTQYAAGYSERAFRKIKVGTSEQEVRSALGRPLRELPAQDGIHLEYSASKSRAKVALYFKHKEIVVSNGVVVQKVSVIKYNFPISL